MIKNKNSVIDFYKRSNHANTVQSTMLHDTSKKSMAKRWGQQIQWVGVASLTPPNIELAKGRLRYF
jgi:hypothetical protein